MSDKTPTIPAHGHGSVRWMERRRLRLAVQRLNETIRRGQRYEQDLQAAREEGQREGVELGVRFATEAATERGLVVVPFEASEPTTGIKALRSHLRLVDEDLDGAA